MKIAVFMGFCSSICIALKRGEREREKEERCRRRRCGSPPRCPVLRSASRELCSQLGQLLSLALSLALAQFLHCGEKIVTHPPPQIFVWFRTKHANLWRPIQFLWLLLVKDCNFSLLMLAILSSFSIQFFH